MWLSCQHRDEENKAAHEKTPPGPVASSEVSAFGNHRVIIAVAPALNLMWLFSDFTDMNSCNFPVCCELPCNASALVACVVKLEVRL
jgi:hypothetical protein